jgi:glycerate kinase
MAPPAVPARPPRRLAATPERAALRLAAPAAEPDPLADRLAAADLALGLIDALEFHDGGGPELARLAAAAASAAVPLVALTPCLAISTRELRTVGVEAAYAVDAAAPATVLDRIAQTWSW